MEEVKITSLNVKGLNVPEKRKMLLNDLRRSGTDVAYVQETHFKAGRLPLLQNRFFPCVYHAPNQQAKSKGVSILISNRVPWCLVDKRVDPNGRFIFLKGSIGNIKVTLATIYVPNKQQDQFVKKILSELRDFIEGRLILGGDFNIPLDPRIDTSSGTSAVPCRVRRSILQKMHEMQVVDAWRTLHTKERDYTFFSNPHQVYSRIDMFLIPHYLISDVTEIIIGNITWSDHAPVSLCLSLSNLATQRKGCWRLNESLLQNPEVRDDVSKEMIAYFQINDIPESDPGMIWEAHKAVIRGILIKHGAILKKKREKQTKELLDEIQTLETQHKKIQTASVGRELGHLRRQLSEILRFKAKALIQRGKQIDYEIGDKCGRLLAGKIKEKNRSTYISQIKDKEGHLKQIPKDIAQTFGKYYATLYNLPHATSPQSRIAEYLTSTGMTRLPSPARYSLDTPITVKEVTEVLKSFKSGKSPGPDGFTISYYREFSELLSKQMTKVFNAVGLTSTFPMDTLRAHITLIPKEGKDPADCGGYRPISLLNTDLKIFTKILATRIQSWIPQIIDLDQVGFVPTREGRDNTTKVLNLINQVNDKKIPCVFLNTDAEKAFDRVDWRFLFEVLKQIGMGERMISWIKSVYTNPQAVVKANGVLSEPFSISNGTRQGCPL